MYPLKISDFQKYWARIEPKVPLFDLANVEFTEWTQTWEMKNRGSKEKGTFDPEKKTYCHFKLWGMRHKKTGEPHGIVRSVCNKGRIFEQSFKDGKFHGFYRKIMIDQKVMVAVCRNHYKPARLFFNKNFEETMLSDEKELLIDIKPAYFRKETEEAFGPMDSDLSESG